MTKKSSCKLKGYVPCKEQTEALKFISKETGINVYKLIHGALDEFLNNTLNKDGVDKYIA